MAERFGTIWFRISIICAASYHIPCFPPRPYCAITACNLNYLIKTDRLLRVAGNCLRPWEVRQFW